MLTPGKWSGHDERMDVQVVEALEDDRTVIRRLLQLYHYDFSEFDGSDVNPHGEYLHRYFDEYWTDSDRKAFLFRGRGRAGRLRPGLYRRAAQHRRVFCDAQVPGRGAGAQAASSLRSVPWTLDRPAAADEPSRHGVLAQDHGYPFQEHEQGTEIVQSFIAADMDG